MSDEKFQNKYRIPSARALWHDYNGGLYFITICTAGREHYFGRISGGRMVLNGLGEFAEKNLRDVTNHYRYAEIPVFQIMPNHIHLIVAISVYDYEFPIDVPVETGRAPSAFPESGRAPSEFSETGRAPSVQGAGNLDEKMQEISRRKGLLSITIGGIKSAVTKYAHDHRISFGWQTRFHDHIIRDYNECNRIATYIENNPALWENDKFYCTGVRAVVR